MDVYKGREIGEPRETNLGSKVVLKLSEPFQKSGRNITSDNFFTNLELGKKLLMQNLTIVGTIRKNRKEIPAEFVSTKDRKEFTTLYGFKKEATIASYCPKKRKDGYSSKYHAFSQRQRLVRRKYQKSLLTTTQQKGM